MNCSEARSLIGPDLLPTPTSAQADGAFEHYQKCEACQRFYAHQVRLANRLKLLSSAKAPPDLRGRVIAALDAETNRQSAAGRARTTRRWVAGLVAAAAALAAFLFATPDRASHARRAALSLAQSASESQVADDMASGETDRLRSWLTTRVGAPVEIPDIPEAQLTGGHIARLDGVATAAIHYEYHGMQLMYFMIPTSTVSQRMPEDDDLWSFTAGGYELVLWREGTTTRAVMAPMPRAELEAIAEHCRSKTMI